MAKLESLGWDYFTFTLFVAVTVLAPLARRLFGEAWSLSKSNFVFATGGVSILSIMISISRGTLGVRSVLGYPSELFYQGTSMWETIYGMILAFPIVGFVFVPVYFNLHITSVYQYIEMRFKSRLVRLLVSATYIVRQIFTLGITVYTPSVALSTVIGIPYWASIVGMSLICMFFTILGGLKASINADIIQTVTIVVVSLAVIIRGLIVSGGIAAAYEVNRDNNRFRFFRFTGDMTVRVDTVSAVFGQLFMSVSQYGCQQNFMQRYVSLKSMQEVKKAMTLNIPMIFVFFSLSWLVGVVIYATYSHCDPHANGSIKIRDEILPYFVEDQLSFIPGFVGIFMAALFNGALCMMVTNLNSTATVIWEDFLSPLPRLRNFNDRQQMHLINLLIIICGVIITGFAFVVSMMSGVIETAMLTISATSGPLLGCFILAMLVPSANWKGTVIGMFSSIAFIAWMIIGSYNLYSYNSDLLPTSTSGCTNTTMISSSAPDTILDDVPVNRSEQLQPLEYFYSISYMYYSLLGTVVTVVVGSIISALTQSNADAYDPKFLHPLVLKLTLMCCGHRPYLVNENLGNDQRLGKSTSRAAAGATTTARATAGADNAKDNLSYEAAPNEARIDINGKSVRQHCKEMNSWSPSNATTMTTVKRWLSKASVPSAITQGCGISTANTYVLEKGAGVYRKTDAAA